MEEATLVHEAELTVDGASYQILVYRHVDGRYFALTDLSKNDIVINDGDSLETALAKQRSVLPLAIGSRLILAEFRGRSRMPAGCQL
ncbi:hypothetical protein GURASL_12930 [Geotalea uraniireducens]|uniref:DUF1830 domain-containing protein n=1 Tax=Geotalea uraniireducens TaxID=351604 RepID=A0ABN6VQ38_9BACT|nr:hypothetical protein [Geotalea uraniireducens]BDV42370.1 hypothetical protein GURASL_12930 [Geotalea uraniireducens]